jgi:hypothetical protein
LTNSKYKSTDAFKLNIYSVTEHRNNKSLKLVDSKVTENENGWLMFKVSQAMNEWIKHPGQNNGLYLSINHINSGW